MCAHGPRFSSFRGENALPHCNFSCWCTATLKEKHSHTFRVLPLSTKMDPLSILGTVTGLISLGQVVIPLLWSFVDDVRSAPKELTGLSAEVTSLYGVLVSIQSSLQRQDASLKLYDATHKGSFSEFGCTLIMSQILLHSHLRSFKTAKPYWRNSPTYCENTNRAIQVRPGVA
jgi:hypothetical protein